VSLQFHLTDDYHNPHSPSDIVPLNFGYKKMREIFRRMPSYRGEVPIGHPCFPEGSAAVCGETTGPVDLNVPDIIYTAEDDEAIDRYHRDRGMSHLYHYDKIPN
jgi:alcohol oxidase